MAEATEAGKADTHRGEDAKLLASREELYGSKLRSFVEFAPATWGQLSEITGLQWGNVRFDDSLVVFRETKSHEDRKVPIAPESGLLNNLRRLQVQTLQDGGPFVAFSYKSNLHKK